MKRSPLLIIPPLLLIIIFLLVMVLTPGTRAIGGKAHAGAPPAIQVVPGAVDLVVTPGSSPAPQTVTLKNNTTSLLNWSAATADTWVSVNPSSGSLAAGTSTPLMLTFSMPTSTMPQTYTTNLVITDVGGVNSPVSTPITVAATTPSTTWYFAEGYTGGSFTEFLTLANPNSMTANVTVTYLLGSGNPIITTYPVPGTSRYTVNVNQAIASSPNKNVSMVVQSDLPIVAERPIYFTFTGLSGYTIPGGSDVLGATQLSTNFDFGYLSNTTGHATFLTILNPSNTSMTATMQYFAATTGTSTTIPHTIAPNSRGTIYFNQEPLPAGNYSALVTLSTPGLVERPMYLKDATTNYTGSADVVGVATPQTNWYFAEGYTSSTFSERYIIANPSTTTPAHATLTFFTSSGPTTPTKVTLPAGQLTIINANSILGNGVNNSAAITSDAPVLAERFISFKYTGPVGNSGSSSIPGASDVLGATTPSTVFYFAEGYTGGQFAEYLTIENPDPSNTASVAVTFLPANGAPPTVQIYSISPSTRFTLFTNNVMPTQSFSMVVESNVPIVAERPMYFNFSNGQTGGSDVVGYEPPAPLPPPPPPTPTPTATNTPTSTPTNTPTVAPTNTPTATPTNTPVPTGTPTPPPVGTGTIVGTVTDTMGNPIGGATITTLPASITTTTDSNGNYSLPNIPAGLYDVIASASDYNANYVPNIFITNSDTMQANITLSAVPAYTAMDTFTRPNQAGWGTASDGNVWNSDNASSPGAAASIQNNLGYVDTYTAGTDLDQWMGPSSANQLVSADFEVLQFGQDSHQHGARLLGRVLDGNHFIAFAINFANQTLELWVNKGGQWTLMKQTSVSRLSVNQWYHAKLLIVGNMAYGKIWAYGASEPDWMIDGTQTMLASGAGGVRSTFANIYWANFSVQSVTTITGKVTSSSTGNPIAGASVSDGTTTTFTDANGNYVLVEPNANATYTITVSANGFTTQNQSVTTTNQTNTVANFALT